ncbi:hypothetical protein [Thermomonas mangrovi]|uniref:hypothetical protein n=1 Tax=Thermomonas mangrovi TaxID=2993316 RepID=UPI002306ED74|nr:hypothetical protein [Thermomonas mangrovi]
MNAVICPIFSRLQSDMERMGLAGADTANVTSLEAARMKREREARERARSQRRGGDHTPPEAA